MKRVFLSLMLVAVGCFAQLDVVESKKELPHGIFFGVGAGVGANAMRFVDQTNPATGLLAKEEQSFASFVASAKVGGYYYFTQMFGLRYYYNLDLNVAPLGEWTVSGNSSPNSAYIFSTSHTANVDVLIKVFSQKNMDISVIGGIGMGALVGELNGKNETLYGNYSKYLDFEFRFNLGARVMFNQKYGVEFMAKLPVTPATRILGADNTRYIKTSPYYFAIDFVMERF